MDGTEEIKQRNLELETLLTISQQFASQLDLDILLEAIPHSIVDTLPAAEAASLWMYDEPRNEMIVRAWAGHDEAIAGLTLSPDTSLVGLVYRSRQPRIVDDAASEPAFELLGQPALDAVRSVLGVPLLVKGQAIGALFADNFSHPNAFDETDLRLLQSLASQAAIGIANARLHEKIQQKAEELELLLDTTTAVSSTLELDTVLHILAEKMVSLVEATFCCIALLDEGNQALNTRAAFGLRDLDWDPGLGQQYALADAPWHRQAVERGETVVLRQDDSSRALSEAECGIVLSEAIQSALLIPLMIGNRVLGVASLGEMRRWERTPFTADRVRLCRAMADQAAIAIENARLYDQARQEIAERMRAEGALRESEQLFRQLVENIREAFWMTDPKNGQLIYISPAYEEIWDRTCQSLYEQPQSYLNTIHPEDRERVIAAQQDPREAFDVEYRIVRADGSVRWIRDRGFPIQNERGEVYRVVGIAEDITAREDEDLNLNLGPLGNLL